MVNVDPRVIFGEIVSCAYPEGAATRDDAGIPVRRGARRREDSR